MHTTNIMSETFEPLIHDMEKQLNKLLTDMILYSASEGKLTAEIDVDYTTMEDGHGIVPMFDFKVSTNIPIKKTIKSFALGNGMFYLGETTMDGSAYILRRKDGQVSIDDLADQINVNDPDDDQEDEK